MFGFLFGTACLVGLCGVAAAGRRRHWAHGQGGGCGDSHGRWGHHGRFGGHGRFRGDPEASGAFRERRRAGVSAAFAEILKRRLRIDEEQEPLVDHAIRDVRGTWGALRGELESARGDLAQLLRAEAIDDAQVDAIFGRVDAALKTARREAVSAAKQVHAVLEPEQRQVAADLLAKDLSEGWVL